MPSSPGYVLFTKNCSICNTPLELKNQRDLERKKYCSFSCRSKDTASKVKTTIRKCLECGETFHPTNQVQRYCSISCRPEYKQSTEEQYKRLNSDPTPTRYIKCLLTRKDRKDLSLDEVLELWEEQEGLCALTGLPMTFKRENGTRFRTNLSLDRIEAGGPYIKSNVRLVCAIINKMRLDMEDSELRFWCKKILGD